MERSLARDERDGVHVFVFVAPDNEDPLTGITLGVRVLQDVESIAALDVEDDVLEPDAALFPEVRVLRVVPGEVRHYWQDTSTCARNAHIGIGWSVPKSVPKRRPTPIHPPANANPVPNKKLARNRQFQARFVTPGSLSKPPPSASGPPHRGEKAKYKRDRD